MLLKEEKHFKMWSNRDCSIAMCHNIQLPGKVDSRYVDPFNSIHVDDQTVSTKSFVGKQNWSRHFGTILSDSYLENTHLPWIPSHYTLGQGNCEVAERKYNCTYTVSTHNMLSDISRSPPIKYLCHGTWPRESWNEDWDIRMRWRKEKIPNLFL